MPDLRTFLDHCPECRAVGDGRHKPWCPTLAPAKAPKQNVLEALEQFSTALAACKKKAHDGELTPEKLQEALTWLADGVAEVTKTVQTEL